MKLSEIISNIKCLEVHNFSERDIDHAVSDSREKFHNSIFIAVKGLTGDGAVFANDAINYGAIAVIYETEIRNMLSNIVYIKVENSRIIQSRIAGLIYSSPSEKLNLVGVTGTNGKTSFAYIYRHILEQNKERCCLLGTTEYDLGKRKFVPSRTTPDAVFLQRYFKEILSSGVSNTVMEVSSHALSLHRVEEVFFDTAVFTNLTRDHLDFHKKMDDYAIVKSKLFSKHLKNGGISVINKDDGYSEMMIKSAAYGVRTFSEKDRDTDLFIKNIEYLNDGMEIEYIYEGKPLRIRTNLNGKFQAYNIAAAILSAMNLNFSNEQIAGAMEKPLYIPGRMENIYHKDFRIIIDYAHSPDALERALKAIRDFKRGKLITVFGCGGNRDTEKRPIMGNIAAALSDFVILTSDNPRNEEPKAILDEIKKGIKKDNYEVITDRKTAIKRSIELAEKGDIVFIAGKGHETYQEIGGVKYPYSDAETVKLLLGN
ncbi:MAG: UDP-N-acetylmuramoyl-L-alanyl-D-glutamate--2,6-diaminopimelate ligase [Candidatus Delongbacteria bacterium]|nr:UDP-N-acetylmuramoyl-L-alanyl-D-glutamate--2,6-diaminopimelate ligase [Candidatus Delongbacteria bacterium]